MASKIDANFENRFFEKTWFYFSENHYFEGSGGRSWKQKSIKNQSKIDQQIIQAAQQQKIKKVQNVQ